MTTRLSQPSPGWMAHPSLRRGTHGNLPSQKRSFTSCPLASRLLASALFPFSPSLCPVCFGGPVLLRFPA